MPRCSRAATATHNRVFVIQTQANSRSGRGVATVLHVLLLLLLLFLHLLEHALFCQLGLVQPLLLPPVALLQALVVDRVSTRRWLQPHVHTPVKAGPNMLCSGRCVERGGSVVAKHWRRLAVRARVAVHSRAVSAGGRPQQLRLRLRLRLHMRRLWRDGAALQLAGAGLDAQVLIVVWAQRLLAVRAAACGMLLVWVWWGLISMDSHGMSSLW